MRLDLHSTIQISPLRAERDHVDAEAGGGDELEQRREVEAAQVAADAARQPLAGEEEPSGMGPALRPCARGVKGRGGATLGGAAVAKGPVTGS